MGRLSKGGRRLGASVGVLGIAATIAPCWVPTGKGASLQAGVPIAAMIEETGFASAGLRLRPVEEPPPEPVFLGRDGEKITIARIRLFLETRGSPLARHADRIVDAGARYEVDPRVVVAISGVESSFGVYASGHNAWGWRGSLWGSWPVAIESYTRALAASYRSLRTGRFAAASRRYCPPCGSLWGIKARAIFVQI
jgi:hypothetical protein